MKVRLLTSLIPFVLGLIACKSSPSHVTFAPDQCYTLALGQWAPPIVPAEDSVFHRAPPGFRLTRDTLASVRKLRVWPAIVVAPWTRQVGYWSVPRAGELLVAWGDGFTGVGIHLRSAGDSLVGVATLSTDNHGSSYRDARASAVARQSNCDSIDSTWTARSASPGA